MRIRIVCTQEAGRHPTRISFGGRTLLPELHRCLESAGGCIRADEEAQIELLLRNSDDSIAKD